MKTFSPSHLLKPGYLTRFLTVIGMIILASFTEKTLDQSPYKLVPSSQIKVLGTSNLHDWTMLSTSFNCEGSFIVKNNQLQDLSALSFVLPVKSLKSKEDLMDTRAYKALKAAAYSKITFKLTQATVLSQQKIIKATGNLTIAGVTNQVMLQTNYVLNADESITCKGSKTIKMGDYGIKAPSFMMGALKTGDEVTIDIQLKFKN
jgi:polyisoprenoid-binding protein YceI